MSLKLLAEKVLERNAQRNAGGTSLFHPPEQKPPEEDLSGTPLKVLAERVLERNARQGVGRTTDQSTSAKKATSLPAPEGVPSEWAKGVCRLLTIPAHAAWPTDSWPVTQDDAYRFFRTWGAQAHRLGWTELDLFGVHRHAPWARLDGMGLVPLLQGREVVVLAEDKAAIKTATGGTLTYRRKKPPYPGECCLIWEL